LLTQAGFEDVSVEITRRYTVAEAGLDAATLPAGWEEADGKVAGAFIRASRPLSAAASPAQKGAREQPVAADGACCGESCCG
jgi:hypothetical protein